MLRRGPAAPRARRWRAGGRAGSAAQREEPGGVPAGRGRGRGREEEGAGRGRSRSSRSAERCAASSPLVQEHDGHAWRRCHRGWRGPRARAALQPELRSRAQGGWALRSALGTPVRVLRATPPRALCPETLGLPGPCAFLAAPVPPPQPGSRCPGVESHGRQAHPNFWHLSRLCQARERKLGRDSPTQLSSANSRLM